MKEKKLHSTGRKETTKTSQTTRHKGLYPLRATLQRKARRILVRLTIAIRKVVGELKRFLVSLTHSRYRSTICLVALLTLLLPGKNVYFELSLNPQKPFIRAQPLELAPPAKYPVRNPNTLDPKISARAAFVLDVNSGSILFEKKGSEKLLPASTTKIMTALIALENYTLDAVITVNRADRAIGQTMGLEAGEQMTVENLLYGLLLESGNDAAFALAESFPGGYDRFVEAMNRRAAELHLSNTQFRNVSGVEQEGHYTTVIDLARLSAFAMKNPTFSQIVSTRNKTVTNVEGTLAHNLSNRNLLLGEVQGIRGVKTGWTENAGECLVTDTVRSGNEVITVVLGSANRFADSQTLIEWAFAAHTWVTPREFSY